MIRRRAIGNARHCNRRVGTGCQFALVVLATLAAGGCADSGSPSVTSKPGATSALPAPTIALDSPEPLPQAEVPPEPPIQPEPVVAAEPPPIAPSGPILGKKTDDIRDAKKELAAGAKKKEPRITGNDPISVSGSAYAAIVGRTEQLRIEATLKYYYAEHQRYPKDLDEFMREIIKPNGIRLTQLPYYQKYAYDAQRHALVILEYPHE